MQPTGDLVDGLDDVVGDQRLELERDLAALGHRVDATANREQPWALVGDVIEPRLLGDLAQVNDLEPPALAERLGELDQHLGRALVAKERDDHGRLIAEGRLRQGLDRGVDRLQQIGGSSSLRSSFFTGSPVSAAGQGPRALILSTIELWLSGQISKTAPAGASWLRPSRREADGTSSPLRCQVQSNEVCL